MILQSSPFSNNTYDCLDGNNIPKICEYVLKYEELNRELNKAQRHLRELRENCPPSNDQILAAMQTALGTVEAKQTDSQLREAFAGVVEQFADSFSRVGVGRQFTQQKATPALQRLFVHDASERLREQFRALHRKDDAPAHMAKVRDAEQRVAKIEKSIEQHVACALLNFRDGRLPVLFRSKPRAGMLQHFSLPAGTTDTTIGLRILLEAISTWRTLAGHFPEPVTVHSTAISSLSPDRRKTAATAYELMNLKPSTRKPQYCPRTEPRTPGDAKHRTRIWGSV